MNGDAEVESFEGAIAELLGGQSLTAVLSSAPEDVRPFVALFGQLLSASSAEPRPEFRSALRARLTGKARAEPQHAPLATMARRVAIAAAAALVLGSAAQPALAESLVKSVRDTFGVAVARVVQDLFEANGIPPTDAGAEGPSEAPPNTATGTPEDPSPEEVGFAGVAPEVRVPSPDRAPTDAAIPRPERSADLPVPQPKRTSGLHDTVSGDAGTSGVGIAPEGDVPVLLVAPQPTEHAEQPAGPSVQRGLGTEAGSAQVNVASATSSTLDTALPDPEPQGPPTGTGLPGNPNAHGGNPNSAGANANVRRGGVSRPATPAAANDAQGSEQTKNGPPLAPPGNDNAPGHGAAANSKAPSNDMSPSRPPGKDNRLSDQPANAANGPAG